MLEKILKGTIQTEEENKNNQDSIGRINLIRRFDKQMRIINNSNIGNKMTGSNA